MRLNGVVLMGAVLAAAATSANAQTVIATCKEPKGKLHSVNPRRGWDNFRHSGMVLTFTRDRFGRPDILIRDRQRLTSLRKDGASLRLSYHSKDFSYFIITAMYQQARVETFQVTFGPDGKGRLLWSSLQSHMPPRDVTMGMLLAANCSR